MLTTSVDILPIINRTYDLYKLGFDICEHLEKRYRYSLGASLEQSILSLLEYLTMAKSAPAPMKATYLLRANGQLDLARFKVRLMLELGLVNETKLFQAQAALGEIGRMLGGWLKKILSTR